MKFYNFLNEDIVKKALDISEPKIGENYPEEKINRYLDMIEKALNAMKNAEENDANDAIVQDLRDKKKKWSNVDKETKPKKIKQEEPPPEQQEPNPPPQQQESAIKKILEGKMRLGKKDSKAFRIVNFIQKWPDWYYSDVPRKELISDLMKEFKLDKKKADEILKVNWDFRDRKINLGEFQDFIHMIIQNKY